MSQSEYPIAASSNLHPQNDVVLTILWPSNPPPVLDMLDATALPEMPAIPQDCDDAHSEVTLTVPPGPAKC